MTISSRLCLLLLPGLIFFTGCQPIQYDDSVTSNVSVPTQVSRQQLIHHLISKGVVFNQFGQDTTLLLPVGLIYNTNSANLKRERGVAKLLKDVGAFLNSYEYEMASVTGCIVQDMPGLGRRQAQHISKIIFGRKKGVVVSLKEEYLHSTPSLVGMDEGFVRIHIRYKYAPQMIL